MGYLDLAEQALKEAGTVPALPDVPSLGQRPPGEESEQSEQSPDLTPAEETRFVAVIRQLEAERWDIPARQVRVWSPPPCRPSRKRPGDG